jgi:hypothetical protein
LIDKVENLDFSRTLQDPLLCKKKGCSRIE